MRITTDQLPQHLDRGLQNLYVVFGDEPLLALEAADRIRHAARRAGYAERTVLVAEPGFRWNELAMAAGSVSLFAAQRLLEIRIPNGKPGVDGGAALQAFAKRLPADTLTLVELPALDWRTQKSAWFEALEGIGVCVEARAVAHRELPQWLAARLKAQDQRADSETLAFIADRVEGNLMAAHQEVQKLALLYPGGAVALEQVRDAVLDVARYDVFALGEVLLEGDRLRLVRTLDGLKGEGAAPPLVLWMLSEEIRLIGKVLAALRVGKPANLAIQDARVRGPAHQNLMRAHHGRFTIEQVTAGLRHAARIDRVVKGLEKGDVWDELLQLALSFARSDGGNARRNRGPRQR